MNIPEGCVCMDCDTPLTPENVAKDIVDKGEPIEEWEEADTMESLVRSADIVELVCFECWMKRMGA
jgi:hypothetical protein